MKSEIILIDREHVDNNAVAYFSSICGFNRNKEKFKAMMDIGLSVRDKISDKINMKAVVSSFGKECVFGNFLSLNEIKVECRALEQINKEKICKVYAYMLTAGNVEIKDSSLIEMFYADTWGTAYIDAGRDFLRAMIREDCLRDKITNNNEEEEKIFVSDSFGPGYYGIDITEVSKLSQVLDGGKIGLKVSESGLMIPVKSCTGFYVVVDDELELPGEDCKSCCSNKKGCQFCRIKTAKRS